MLGSNTDRVQCRDNGKGRMTASTSATEDFLFDGQTEFRWFIEELTPEHELDSASLLGQSQPSLEELLESRAAAAEAALTSERALSACLAAKLATVKANYDNLLKESDQLVERLKERDARLLSLEKKLHAALRGPILDEETFPLLSHEWRHAYVENLQANSKKRKLLQQQESADSAHE